MASIGIIGLGNWGTALAKVWGSTGHNIAGWNYRIKKYMHQPLKLESMKSIFQVKN